MGADLTQNWPSVGERGAVKSLEDLSPYRWGPATQSLTQFSRAHVGMGWRFKPIMQATAF
jgi:hypothetical protein